MPPVFFSHAPFAKRKGARASEAMRAGDARGGDGRTPQTAEHQSTLITHNPAPITPSHTLETHKNPTNRVGSNIQSLRIKQLKIETQLFIKVF